MSESVYLKQIIQSSQQTGVTGRKVIQGKIYRFNDLGEHKKVKISLKIKKKKKKMKKRDKSTCIQLIQ